MSIITSKMTLLIITIIVLLLFLLGRKNRELPNDVTEKTDELITVIMPTIEDGKRHEV